MKIYLYKRFKIGVLGTSQRCHPTDAFSERFEDLCRTFLQNVCRTFLQEYATANFSVFHAIHLVSRIENNTKLMCFVLCSKLSYWRRKLASLFRCHFRTQLGRPWNVSPKFMRNWINSLTIASWWYAETIFETCCSNKFYIMH